MLYYTNYAFVFDRYQYEFQSEKDHNAQYLLNILSIFEHSLTNITLHARDQDATTLLSSLLQLNNQLDDVIDGINVSNTEWH